MPHEPLMLHLATTLTALDDARASAASTSPTWLGVDRVEAATREVLTAAHALVTAEALVQGRMRPHVVPHEEDTLYMPFLQVGMYFFNKEQVTHVMDYGNFIDVNLVGPARMKFYNVQAEQVRAWLVANSEVVLFTEMGDDLRKESE